MVVAKSFRPRLTVVAFTVLAVVSAVGLTLSGNNTPYAAEVPSAPGPVPAEPSSAAPTSAAPRSASPRSAQPRRTSAQTPPTSAGNGRTSTVATSAIPPDAMLSASDLGAGVTGNEERVDDHGSLATMLTY